MGRMGTAHNSPKETTNQHPCNTQDNVMVTIISLYYNHSAANKIQHSYSFENNGTFDKTTKQTPNTFFPVLPLEPVRPEISSQI